MTTITDEQRRSDGNRFDDWRQEQLAETWELDGTIAQLKMIRTRALELVDLAESFDIRLAAEFGTVRAHVEEHLAHVLLRRELLLDRQP